MKRLLKTAVALSALAFMACSSQPTGTDYNNWKSSNGYGASTKSFAPIIVPMGTRAPANAPATYRWEPQTVALTVRPDTTSLRATVQVEEQKSWTTTEACTEYKMVNEIRFGETTCYDMICPDSGGGKSALWNAFYSSKKSEKVKALSAAIKGIGDVSSEKLIAAGYFSKKPRTWEEFRTEIYKARDAGLIGKGIARSVVVDYRAENSESLGYASCQDRPYTCNDYYLFSGYANVDSYCPRSHKQVSNTRQFNVAINVSDAKLMSTETEALSFDLNEVGQVLQNSISGNFNRYSVTTSTQDMNVTVNLRAEQRFMKNIESTLVWKQNWALVSGVPTFVLDIDPSTVPGSDDPGAKLIMNYTVKYCKAGTFGCAIWGGEEKVLKTESLQIKEARTIMNDINPTNLKGKNVWIDYSFSRQGSKFYKADSSRGYNTDRIKF